uniref:RCC1 domain-containing protein n=1 Tax=uncultured Chloroflexus sp. TaxID=214040 RepID=UPI00345C7544
GTTCFGTSTPVAVRGLSGVSAIAAGGDHTCALTTAGEVRCWGRNSRGQLGNGTTTDSSTPVAVSGLIGVSAIATGGEHTCALTMAGEVRCWGSNSRGQLGNGTTTDSSTPVAVSGLASEVRAIATGFDHTCALTTAGEVRCWGNNYFGQLGDGRIFFSTMPMNVFFSTMPTNVIRLLFLPLIAK